MKEEQPDAAGLPDVESTGGLPVVLVRAQDLNLADAQRLAGMVFFQRAERGDALNDLFARRPVRGVEGLAQFTHSVISGRSSTEVPGGRETVWDLAGEGIMWAASACTIVAHTPEAKGEVLDAWFPWAHAIQGYDSLSLAGQALSSAGSTQGKDFADIPTLWNDILASPERARNWTSVLPALRDSELWRAIGRAFGDAGASGFAPVLLWWSGAAHHFMDAARHYTNYQQDAWYGVPFQGVPVASMALFPAWAAGAQSAVLAGMGDTPQAVAAIGHTVLAATAFTITGEPVLRQPWEALSTG